MLLTAMSLKDMLSTIAFMALLAVVLGNVMRRVERILLAQLGLGALFGAAAVLAVLDPLEVAPGIIVDLRGVPVALAGGFLGWPGALVAGGMAAAMRVYTGGVGAFAGVLGIALAALTGLAWAALHRRREAQKRRGALGLALLSSLYVLSIFLLPWSVAWPTFLAVAPFLLPLHALGVFTVGHLMERERRMMAVERLLARAASRDPLTGLLNRRGFEAAVLYATRNTWRGFEAAVLRAPHNAWGSALLVLELDRFKRITDEHGHIAGDAVLSALGPRLHEVLGEDAMVARFGGEEVGVFLPAIGPAAARRVAKQLCEAVRAEPFVLPDGSSIAVSASVGGAWGEAPVTPDELMVRADATLCEAQNARGNCSRLDDGGAASRGAQELRRIVA